MQPTRTQFLFTWLALAAGFLIAGGIISFVCVKLATRDEEKADTTTSSGQADEKPITIKAVDLYDTYKANPMQGDRLFYGKLLQVVDSALDLETDYVGFTIALPGTPQIVCYVPEKNREPFANIHRRKPPYAVIGRCRGMRDEPSAWGGKAIILENCRLAP